MQMKTPNKNKIELILDELKIKPNFISSYFLEENMFVMKNRKVKGKEKHEIRKVPAIADRTFADILKGNSTKEDNLKALADLFTKRYKKNGKNKIISVSDIAIEEKKGPLINNLRLIKNYNDLIIDRWSIYRIPFFNFNINNETEPKVSKLLKLIDEIYDFFQSKVKLDSIEERTDLSKYSGEIKIISEVNSILKSLNEKKIYLYSGLLKNIPQLETKIEHRSEYVESGSDYPDEKIYWDVSEKVSEIDYNIYNFTNYKISNYIEAIYRPSFSYEELKKEVKKNPFKKTYEILSKSDEEMDSEIKSKKIDTKLDFQSFYGDIFYKKYNHTGYLPFNFEREKIEFRIQKNKYDKHYYKKGDDPLFDEYLEEHNLTYEEAMQQGEDLAAEQLINYSRGKWI